MGAAGRFVVGVTVGLLAGLVVGVAARSVEGDGWRSVGFCFTLDVGVDVGVRLGRWAGASRFAYNALLAQVKAGLDVRAAERAATGVATTKVVWSRLDLIRASYRLRRELAWGSEVPAAVFECAAVDLAAGLSNWALSRAGRRRGKKIGFPRFHTKRRTMPRFRLRHPEQLRAEGRRLRVSCLGWVGVREDTRRLRRLLDGGRFRPYSTTISYRLGRWQLAINGTAAPFHPQHRRQDRSPVPVGVDLGVRHLATVVDATGRLLEVREGVNPYQHAKRRLRRAQRGWARTKPGSAGRRDATRRLARLHGRVANQRRHQLHELSTALVCRYDTIVIEDLHVAGMLAQHALAARVADQGFGELRRQLTYKTEWYGNQLIVADRWYPSSKTCHACGHHHTQLGRQARFVCPACGLALDRDHNAAINLARLAPRRHVAGVVKRRWSVGL